MAIGLKKIESVDEFIHWVTTAKRGHRVSYYRGWLMKDKLSKMPQMVRGNMILPEFKLADKAWEFHQVGAVELFQKRHGDEDYEYIAVAI